MAKCCSLRLMTKTTGIPNARDLTEWFGVKGSLKMTLLQHPIALGSITFH